MKGNISFELLLSADGKVYDISFKRSDKLSITSIKKEEKLVEIRENPLIEECEKKEEDQEIKTEGKTIFEDDNSEEEDESITRIYEGVTYVSFPGIKSIYREKDLKYMGSLEEGVFSNFIPTG
tara:strand:+ start:1901 stop:2269 length:369 start_codon:yes stop_codon:yes gene_type:complete